MGLVLGKSKALIPKDVKIIKHVGHPEKKYTEMVTKIAKEFGQVSKKLKPKKLPIFNK